MTKDRLNMLVVNDQPETMEVFMLCLQEDGFDLKYDLEVSAHSVVKNRDPLNYNIAIIDASDDRLGGNNTLSKFLKSKNENMIIVGTSALGTYFQKDSLSNQLYDEKISMNMSFLEELKATLKKYGWEGSK